MADFDVSELRALSRDFGKIGARSTGVMFGVFKEAGNDLRDQWRRNATETAGQHGKHYPKSITADMRVGLNIEVEIGPDPSMPQGGMSFEYGSAKQPPHLDGQRATDEVVPKIDKKIDSALDRLGL